MPAHAEALAGLLRTGPSARRPSASSRQAGGAWPGSKGPCTPDRCPVSGDDGRNRIKIKWLCRSMCLLGKFGVQGMSLVSLYGLVVLSGAPAPAAG